MSKYWEINIVIASFTYLNFELPQCTLKLLVVLTQDAFLIVTALPFTGKSLKKILAVHTIPPANHRYTLENTLSLASLQEPHSQRCPSMSLLCPRATREHRRTQAMLNSLMHHSVLQQTSNALPAH